MASVSEQYIAAGKKSFLRIVILGIIGIAINMIGSLTVSYFGLPLYFDFIGTAIVAAISGYLPGIIVGFLTNMLHSITEPVSVFYGTISVINSVVITYAAHKKWFKKLPTILLTIIILAIFGGGVGSLLTWLLYGFEAEATTAGLVGVFYEAGLSPLASEFWASMVIDILDKAITVIAVMIVLKLLPDRVYKSLQFAGFRQAPLSKEELRAAKHEMYRKTSLRTKLVLMITIAGSAIALSATAISFLLYRNASIDDHKQLGEGAAALAASVIDGDRVDEYIEYGRKAEGYEKTEQLLYKIRESSPDIEYLYVYRIEEDGCHVVFDLDTDDLKGAEPGEVIPFDETYMPYIPKLLAGEDIDPLVSDDSYGWLLTDYEPVYDSKGVVRCYAAIDISMDQLKQDGYGFLARMISLFLGILIIVLALGIWVAEFDIILPVNTMTMAASAFERKSDEALTDSVERIRSLGISTGDEIESLYHAFASMTEDNLKYMEDIRAKNETITGMQNALILVLADMVESRDKNTGDNVRKTAAYTKIIMDELKKEGIYTDQLTDEFVSDVFNSAPLHDVGKINVPDAILNKPGKLDDDEFDKMKTHTTVGGDIIERVISTVPDSGTGYLEEAERLALYHHEKWNGAGYPSGLKGEEIPLSARIMAVADVFDALVSDRSYKKGFPFEKAMDIIRESSGSHFDPKIAQAFLNAEEEVRKVAEEFGNNKT